MVTSTSFAASGGSLHLDNGKATGNMVCYHGRVKTRMDIHANTSADKRDDATSGTPYDIPEDDPANASTDAHGNASTPEPPRARRRRPRRIAIAFAALAVLTFVGAAAFVVYASDYYLSLIHIWIRATTPTLRTRRSPKPFAYARNWFKT